MDNFKLGRKVVNSIEDNRINFYMGSWVDHVDDGFTLTPGGDIPPESAMCGMTACLGGWVMLHGGYTVKNLNFYRPDGSIVSDPQIEARNLLGMDFLEEILKDPTAGQEADITLWYDSAEGFDRFKALVEYSEAQATEG